MWGREGREREGEERLMIAVLQAVSSEQEKSHSPTNLESRSINNSPSTVQTRAGVCEREMTYIMNNFF